MCRYIDYVLSWGPAITGHAVDEVNDALKAQIDKGTSFGAPCELEVSLNLKSSKGFLIVFGIVLTDGGVSKFLKSMMSTSPYKEQQYRSNCQNLGLSK